jgi:glycosyltransferase involved in cell wall biosynthesis/GT2 family glycosyltransferase
MRASVVINTYNRAKSLPNTLRGLRQQTQDDFEVVVVKGPCTDDTDAVLAEFPAARVVEIGEVNISRSRNAGIIAAAGEIVAFIDDDAIPEPNWLRDLLAPFASPKVGGTGGLVYEPSGFELQYRYSICDRTGSNSFEVMPPFDEYVRPGADPFVYLQGTNTAFRRTCLQDIGGFDEEIEYYLDEVEVCMRVIDLGYQLVPLSNAIVHHKYLASHLRNHQRVVFDPFAVVKNRYYFALQNGARTRPLDEVLATLAHFAAAVREGGEQVFARGDFTAEQLNFYLHRVERGVRLGTDRGLNRPRFHRFIPPPEPARFVRYPTVRPQGRRLTVCFLSQEYPPGDFGGIGRFTCDLATGLAELGHEVHVITHGPDANRVDLEDGVWMHRLENPARCPVEWRSTASAPNLEVTAAAYHEVCRIHERGPVDVVSGPLWLFEGLLCSLDGRFPTVLSLMTSLQTIVTMHPSWRDKDDVRQLLALEGVAARKAEFLHAISRAILDKVRQENGLGAATAAVVPLGIRDRAAEYASRRGPNDGRVRVLFVGRLERRKGVDLLLDAAANLLRADPRIDVVLAGKDTENTETGQTYREWFAQKYGGEPALAGRVRFAGAVSEGELYQLYRECDVFCLPSRYESFGLVLLEAMMFGKPVVGVQVGGMGEIVEDGGNGYLAEPESAASLEECLRRLTGDAELRERFGRRSREIYEAKFSAPIMVANTLAYYADVAAGRHPRTRPANEARPERVGRMAREFASIIAEATGVPHGAALKVAQHLLSPHPHGLCVDYPTHVGNLLNRPPAKFVSELYRLLLGREETPQELAEAVRDLGRGVARGYLVHKLATGEEARQIGLPTAHWLTQAMAAGGVPNVALEGVPAPRGRLARARSLLGRLPLVGKAARYLKRLILLPWNFAKLYQAFQEQQHATRELLAAQKRELCEALDRQGRELRTVVGAQLHDLRSEITRPEPEPLVLSAPERARNAA